MTLKVVEYIKKHGLDALQQNLAIKVREHKDYPNLVLLKYNQIDSPMGNPVVQQCRGIILDRDDDWKVISYPYDKFFNYGEGHAADVDWDTARVYEKLDGSLMTLYWYDKKWHIASSGLPDASGEVAGTNMTFAELFWKTWAGNMPGLSDHPPRNVTNRCYMFELMTPYNRIVVRHKKPSIALHGARDLTNYKELNPVVVAHEMYWKCVQTHSFWSWDEVLYASELLEPMEIEGYIVCDENYNRVKVKSPQYVAIAHMKDGFTTRRVLEIVRTNENSEFLTYFPEYTDVYIKVRSKFDNLVSYIQGYYDAIKHIDDKKSFAMQATKTKYSGPMFALRHGKFDSIKEYLSDMNLRNLESWLDLKSIEL